MVISTPPVRELARCCEAQPAMTIIIHVATSINRAVISRAPGFDTVHTDRARSHSAWALERLAESVAHQPRPAAPDARPLARSRDPAPDLLAFSSRHRAAARLP